MGKRFNIESSLIHDSNFEVLIDDKYNVVYINPEDIEIRENQVFKIQSEDYINSLAEDIKNNGLDNPLVVRKKNNKYDLICGRHRLLALKNLKTQKIPCIIQNLTDEEAEIKLINNNLNQRQEFKPSELAKAYKIKKDIFEKWDTVSQDKENINVYDKIAKDTPYSKKTIQRYLKILDLTDEFIDMVDNRKITINQYSQLIKLNLYEQKILYNTFMMNNIKFSKINKIFIDELITKNITEDNILKILEKNKLKKNIKMQNSKLENLYTELNLEKDKWIEIVKKLKKLKVIK